MSNQQNPLLVTVSAYCDKPDAAITVIVTSNTATTFEEAIKTIKQLSAKAIYDIITEYYEVPDRKDYTEIMATVYTETGPVSFIVETEVTVYGGLCRLCYELDDEKDL